MYGCREVSLGPTTRLRECQRPEILDIVQDQIETLARTQENMKMKVLKTAKEGLTAGKGK